MHGTVRPQASGYAWLTPWPISFYHYLFYINTQSKFPPKKSNNTVFVSTTNYVGIVPYVLQFEEIQSRFINRG